MPDGNQRPSPRHATAREFAAVGVPVFPCEVGGKRPACPNGFKDATTDLVQIDAWWSEADYNLAIEPEQAGWCVLDPDLYKSGTPEAWAALHAEGLPETYVVGTPRGGQHHYYSGSLPGSAHKLGHGIDTRGVGSYVLIPPSVTEDGPYKVLHDRDIAELPEWVAERVRAKDLVVQSAPAGMELDTAGNVARAVAHLKLTPGAVEFQGSDETTYKVACELRELGVSRERALDLMVEHWMPRCVGTWTAEFIAGKIDNAYSYAQNAPGAFAVPPAAVAFGAAAETLVNDEGDYFARFVPASAAVPDFDLTDEPADIAAYLASEPAPPLEMLVDGWIEWGIYIALSGPGGTHKSRLLLMLCLCLLFRRNLFQKNLELNPSDADVRVDHIEYLSCENTEAETRRRIQSMASALRLKPEAKHATMKIWELRETRRALLMVDERDALMITAFGKRMLRRWEKLAETGKRTVLIFDSLFNVVRFKGNSKNSDECAAAVIETLDHWCERLNLTILAPFHPSRAGVQRGDTGYSPVFDNAPRMVLGIKQRVPDRPRDAVPLGQYVFDIRKWNNGRQGRSLILQYEGGILIPMEQPLGSEPHIKAAAQVALGQAYGDDRERIQSPDLADDERAAIEERNHTRDRLRQDGKIGPGRDVRKITNAHWMVTDFQRLTGNKNMGVDDLLRACQAATECSPPLLSYRRNKPGGHAERNGRAGYGAPEPLPDARAVPEHYDEGESGDDEID